MADQEKDLCELRPFERNQYYRGKLLSVDDFQTEQKYIRSLDQTNKYIFTTSYGGVVCGLEVTADNDTITVSSGLAIDGCGRKIVVGSPKPETPELPDNNKDYYVYLKYKEQDKDKVYVTESTWGKGRIAGESGSRTKQYNRIKETCVIKVEATPPHEGQYKIPGTIRELDLENKPGSPISEAVVIAKQKGQVSSWALTRDDGSYELYVNPDLGPCTVQARAPLRGAESQTQQYPSQKELNVQDNHQDIDLYLQTATKNDLPDAETFKAALHEDISDRYLKACFQSKGSQKAKVLVGVIYKDNDGKLSENTTETAKYRKIVPNNTMLYELLLADMEVLRSHLTAKNPHGLTAEDVGALVGVKDTKDLEVKNPGGYVKFVSKNETITIDGNDKANEINIEAKPGKAVRSVGKEKQAGNSPQFARVDHIHDLSNGVVTSSKIGKKQVKRTTIDDKAVNTGQLEDYAVTGVKIAKDALCSSDGTIIIDRDEASKNLDLSALEKGLTTLKIGWNHREEMSLGVFMKGLQLTFNQLLRKDMEPILNETFLVSAKGHTYWGTYHHESLCGEVSPLAQDKYSYIFCPDPKVYHYLNTQIKRQDGRLTIRVQLNCDFIIDVNNKAVDGHVDGNHFPLTRKSGYMWANGKYKGGLRGGLFESWFSLVSSEK